MFIGFKNPGMIIPIGIVVVLIGMFFAVPTLWMRMRPEHPDRLTSWSHFRQHGIVTAYGRCSAAAATIQVLILPVLVLVWGLTVLTIVAAVG
jgi:hypothetical protein